MRRRRFKLVSLVICSLVIATPAPVQAMTPGQAAEPSPSVEQLLRQSTTTADGAQVPVKVPDAPQKADADDCARLLKPNPGATGYATCITSAPPPKASVLTGIGVQDLIPLPQFCIDHAFDGWWMNRTQACAIASKTVVVIEMPSGLPVGTLQFLELNFSYTSGSIATWAQQIELSPFSGTGLGLAPGTLATGFATCRQSCVLNSSSFPPQAATVGRDAEGEAFFDTTATTVGVVGDAFTTFTYTFTNPAWTTPTTPGSASPPRVRCDNAVPGYNQPGCAFMDYVPAMIYSRDGAFPELARHIGDAQASGLPGAYPDGPPLVRMVDDAQQDANRNTACPRSYPRPATKSCDEYPMASTEQGAAQPPLGPGRTHSWCSISALPTGVTSPTGYSSCMIDAWQNSVGGSALNTFFQNNRIIDDDRFYVWIQGTGGGPNPNPPDFPPTANAGPDRSADEGGPITLQGTATDDNGTPTVRWSYRPVANVDPGAACFFGNSGSAQTIFACTDDGTYEITLTADDGIQEFPVSDSATVTVFNVPPFVGRLPGFAVAEDFGIVTPRPWQVFRVGEPVTVTTNFTDQGSNDTHVCAIQWDDGSQESFSSNGYTCGRSHTYTSPGMYTIKPGITDDDGGIAEQLSVLVIVYDPDAGFATAGGHLPSAAGAVVGDPSAQGEGHFQFNPKYLPHDEGPVPSNGKVSFRVQGTSFDLDSTALEWLVVTTDDKIAVKGVGKVNGVDGFGFVAYGYDASTDRFRLVVWPLANGTYPQSTLTYDNRNGTDYDLDLADPQPIGAGSIHAHN
jgi:hypothetical protein